MSVEIDPQELGFRSMFFPGYKLFPRVLCGV